MRSDDVLELVESIVWISSCTAVVCAEADLSPMAVDWLAVVGWLVWYGCTGLQGCCAQARGLKGYVRKGASPFRYEVVWLIADSRLQLPSRQVKQGWLPDSCRKTRYWGFAIAISESVFAVQPVVPCSYGLCQAFAMGGCAGRAFCARVDVLKELQRVWFDR
jgi:hypothetical protein